MTAIYLFGLSTCATIPLQLIVSTTTLLHSSAIAMYHLIPSMPSISVYFWRTPKTHHSFLPLAHSTAGPSKRWYLPFTYQNLQTLAYSTAGPSTRCSLPSAHHSLLPSA